MGTVLVSSDRFGVPGSLGTAEDLVDFGAVEFSDKRDRRAIALLLMAFDLQNSQAATGAASVRELIDFGYSVQRWWR